MATNMLKQIFGPDKEEVWRQLAAQLNGNYVDGGFFGKDKVEVQHADWTITLETLVVSTGKSTIVYTILQAPFHNPDNFRFSINRRGIFTDIGKFFGMQDIATGDPEFDHDFVIQGNNEEKVRQLLANSTIRDLIGLQPKIHFQIKPDDGLFSRKYPVGTERLYFRNLGIIRDLDRLKNLYDLFFATLDQLHQLYPTAGK
jgi:hypothetical protein